MASCFLKLLTWNVVIVSVAMFALGVANITVQCSNSMPSCMAVSSNVMLFDQATSVIFLAVGIWGAIPCLLSGIGKLRGFNKPNPGKNWLWATLLAAAFYFTPLMIIFSAFNATSAMAMINAAGSAASTQWTVAFALPLTIAILAGLVHLHLLLILCHGCQMDEEVTVVEVAKVVQAPPPTLPEPVLRSTAWHVASPAAARCNCQHYGQSPYGC